MTVGNFNISDLDPSDFNITRVVKTPNSEHRYSFFNLYRNCTYELVEYEPAYIPELRSVRWRKCKVHMSGLAFVKMPSYVAHESILSSFVPGMMIGISPTYPTGVRGYYALVSLNNPEGIMPQPEHILPGAITSIVRDNIRVEFLCALGVVPSHFIVTRSLYGGTQVVEDKYGNKSFLPGHFVRQAVYDVLHYDAPALEPPGHSFAPKYEDALDAIYPTVRTDVDYEHSYPHVSYMQAVNYGCIDGKLVSEAGMSSHEWSLFTRMLIRKNCKLNETTADLAKSG